MIWTQYFRLIMIWRVTWNMNKSSHFRTRIATRRGGMASGIALQRGTLESKIVYRRVAADFENRKYIWLTKFSVRFLPNFLEVGPLPRYSWLDPELRNLFPFLPPLCLFNVHLSLLIRQVPHSSLLIRHSSVAQPTDTGYQGPYWTLDDDYHWFRVQTVTPCQQAF